MATKWKENNDGTVTLIRDDGFTQTFIDPDGSFRKELDANSTSSGELAGASGDVTGTPRSHAPQPAAGPVDGFAPMGAAPAGLAENPVVNTAVAKQQAAAAASGPPPVRLTIPGSPGKSSTTTTTDTTNQTTRNVHDKDPEGTIAKAGAEAIDAQREANQADEEARRQNIAVQENLNAAARAEYQGRYNQATHLENTRQLALNEALAARKKARETIIDPGKAFGDGAGAMALMAAIGSAVANVGLAWMGQAARPITIIDDLVERSVRLQQAQKQGMVDEASETVEMTRAQLAAAKADARVAADQLLKQRFAEAQTEQERNSIAVVAKENEAKLKQAEAEFAEAVADEVTTSTTSGSNTSVSTKSESGTPEMTIEIPGGSSEEQVRDAINAKRFDAEASDSDKKQLEKLSENAAFVSERNTIIEELKRLEEEGGYVSDVVGLWQGGSDGVGKFEATRSPKQQRAAQLLTRLEANNRFQWKTEPNSVKTQERLASLGLPKNDRDIPMFFENQEKEINALRNNMYLGYDDPVVGKFRTQHRKVQPGKAEAF